MTERLSPQESLAGSQLDAFARCVPAKPKREQCGPRETRLSSTFAITGPPGKLIVDSGNRREPGSGARDGSSALSRETPEGREYLRARFHRSTPRILQRVKGGRHLHQLDKTLPCARRPHTNESWDHQLHSNRPTVSGIECEMLSNLHSRVRCRVVKIDHPVVLCCLLCRRKIPDLG